MKKLKQLIKYIESHGIFYCPSCRQKRWLPAKIRWYYAKKLNQNVQSNEKHCYKCQKAMIKLLNKMQ